LLIPDCESIPRMAYISMDGKEIFLGTIPKKSVSGCGFVHCTVKWSVLPIRPKSIPR